MKKLLLVFLLNLLLSSFPLMAQNVGIGISNPAYKLHVAGKGYFSDSLISLSLTSGSASVEAGIKGTGSNYGVYGNSTNGAAIFGTSTNGYGVYGQSGYLGVYGNGTSFGTYGYSSAGSGAQGSTSSGKGVYGTASTGYGVYGAGGPYGVYGNGSSYGVWGVSTYLGVYGDGTSYGVYGNSNGANGVYGNSTNGTGVYGYSSNYHGGHFYSGNNNALWAKTGTPNTSGIYAGVFEGSVYSFGSYQGSDKNLKKNIQDIEDAMSIINKLKPKNYEFRNDGKYASLNLPTGNHYGLIAQELEEVLPNLVANAPHGLGAITPEPNIEKNPKETAADVQQKEASEIPDIKGVNYTELIPILIKGMQEQQKQIGLLLKRIEVLEKK